MVYWLVSYICCDYLFSPQFVDFSSAPRMYFPQFLLFSNTDERRTDERSDGSNVSVYIIYGLLHSLCYNGDDPSGIMFVEFFAPGEKYSAPKQER